MQRFKSALFIGAHCNARVAIGPEFATDQKCSSFVAHGLLRECIMASEDNLHGLFISVDSVALLHTVVLETTFGFRM
jgi:hypothetical protein